MVNRTGRPTGAGQVVGEDELAEISRAGYAEAALAVPQRRGLELMQ